MAEKRRGLGRGLGALIPSGPTGAGRPVDVFFPGSSTPLDPEAAEIVAEAVGPEAGDPAVVETAAGSAATAIPAPHDAAEPGRDDDADGPADRSGAPSEARTDAEGGVIDETAAETAATYPAREASAVEPPESTSPSADDADDALVPVPGARFAEVPVGDIRPNPRQPRTVFDEDALAELVGSIQEIGVLQPVVVRPTGDAAGAPYELIMGERRWRATQAAGLSTIPAIIRETEDEDLLRDALLENLHRSQLNALEEAAAYQQLLDDFGCTHEELAQRIHRSRPQISNTLRLLRLPPLVQRRVAAGVLSAGHARALLGLPDAASMERLAQRIVAEGLSVRATEEIVTLGGDPDRSRPVRRTRAGERNAALDDLAGRLSDRFDTRVKISLGKTKGRLTVEFASVQDLNRILSTLSPEDPGVLR
jgi:ParB family transcriptional regulator, chromosome partitioning protein